MGIKRLVGTGAVATLLAAVWLLARGHAGAREGPAAGQPVAIAGAQLEGQGRGRRTSSGPRLGALADGLSSRLSARRVAALEAIAETGGDDASLRPAVELLTRDPDPRTALWAQAALFHLGGAASLRAAVCRTALENPGWNDAERALRSVAPGVADALLQAAVEQRARRAQGTALEGLDAVLDGWVRDSGTAGSDVAPPLARASEDDLAAWLSIVRGLRPVPVAALYVLAGRLRTATPHDAGVIAKFFAAGPELSLADDEVERALLDRALAAPQGQATPWLLALARLPRLSLETRARLAVLRDRDSS